MRTRRTMVAVIGGNTVPAEGLEAAERLGRLLNEAGHRVVCGGRGGVMEAACRGARKAATYREGDTMGILPTLDATTANDFVDIVIPTGMQYARNLLVVATGDAVIAVGGGAGTLSEIALAWQCHKPVIALDIAGGWSAELAGRGLDHRREEVILRAGSPEEAMAHLTRLLAQPRRPHAGF